MKNYTFLFLSIALLTITACKKKDPQLGEVPTQADAAFTYQSSAANANIIEFTAVNSELQVVWDLGNGQTPSGTKVSGIYPNAGTYTVKLSVFGSGGSASSTQEIIIDQTDPTLLDGPIYVALTGGSSGPGFKTWVIDSISSAHFGVGPDPIGAAGDFPEWWSAGPVAKAGVGMYDDKYTFYLNNFQYDMVNNGDVYVHNSLAGDFPGSYENLSDFTAPYSDQLNESWVVTEGVETILSVSGAAFLGMWTGFNDYKIIEYSETSLWLSYKHHAGGLTWYLRLIPEGFDSSGGGGGGTDPTFDLPIDCESVQPLFVTFGNSTASVVTNPDQIGINTSANVIETVHGNEVWSGFYVDLTTPLDFSINGVIALKVWAPTTGDFRFKVENSANTNDFVELDATITAANTWQEIMVDFGAAGAASGVYDRFVMFPGWGVANAGTFYVDDIIQQ